MSEALNCVAAGFLEILNRDERGDETEEPRPRADGGEEFREEPRARPDGGGEPRARSRAVRIPRPKVRSAFHTSAASSNSIALRTARNTARSFEGIRLLMLRAS